MTKKQERESRGKKERGGKFLEEGIGVNKSPLMVLTGTMKCIKHVNMLFNQEIEKVMHAYTLRDVFA
jgi:hypothetical protein